MTVGARGLGSAAGYELQRFAWTGTFDRTDFIDGDNRPRAWDDGRAILAGKGLQMMTDNAELRRLLGAVDDETNASGELVPLADARDQPRFRQTFQRLLQLRDRRQDDLKHLLADCAKLSLSAREIDLANDFEKELGKINRDRTEVAALRAAAPLFKQAQRHPETDRTVAMLLKAAGYSLQANHKTREGSSRSGAWLAGECLIEPVAQ